MSSDLIKGDRTKIRMDQGEFFIYCGRNFSDKFLKLNQINMQIVENIQEFFQIFKIIN